MSAFIETPLCFVSRSQFQEWRRLNNATKELAWVCDDCTAEYKELMQLEARCDQECWGGVAFGPDFSWKKKKRKKADAAASTEEHNLKEVLNHA